jgi:hypothetical protein
MALNAIDSTGVSHSEILRMKEWRRRLLLEESIYIQVGADTFQRDAEYIVQHLQAVLFIVPRPEEEEEKEDGIVIPNDARPRKTLVLSFLFTRGSLTDEAITVFCTFLQSAANNNNNNNAQHSLQVRLSGIAKDLPHLQLRRLLKALHTNTFVKELEIFDCNDDDVCGWISNMLKHKTDLVDLSFAVCKPRRDSLIALLVPGLGHQPHAQLYNLEFRNCAIGDDDVHLLLETIRQGYFPWLESVHLVRNCIKSAGLRWLAELGPVALRRLQKLNLNNN